MIEWPPRVTSVALLYSATVHSINVYIVSLIISSLCTMLTCGPATTVSVSYCALQTVLHGPTCCDRGTVMEVLRNIGLEARGNLQLLVKIRHELC
jgi:hypothetical protein